MNYNDPNSTDIAFYSFYPAFDNSYATNLNVLVFQFINKHSNWI